MFNQEQLAAIAAAMSFLQQSLRSDSQILNASAAAAGVADAETDADPNANSSINHLSSIHLNNHNQLNSNNNNNNNNNVNNNNHHHNLHQMPQNHVTPNQLANNRPVSYSAIVAKSAGLANNLLALEPTINYATTDHFSTPTQQLFPRANSLNQPHHLQTNHHLQPQQHPQQQQPLNQQHHQPQLPQIPQQQSLQLQQPLQLQQQQHPHHQLNNQQFNPPSLSTNNMPSPGSATNLLGFMGLYVGNLSPDLTKEQLEKIFSKYGEPVKAHRLIRSPVAFIKYENTESPRAAIDDLYGLLLPELTLNQDQPLKLHFDRNDAQLKANYRPTELPPNADNGECYGWRTTVCRRGKNCPKKHIPINRGIDFQMWMIKSTNTWTTSSTTITTTTAT